MKEISGHRWAELQANALLEGEICTDHGDDMRFIARCPTS